MPDTSLRGIVCSVRQPAQPQPDPRGGVRRLRRRHRAAGGPPLVLMQCSGLGNALNALGSLAIPFGLAFRSCSRCAGRSASATRRRCRWAGPRSMLEALGSRSSPARDRCAAALGAASSSCRRGPHVAALLLEPRAGARRGRARALAAALDGLPDALVVTSLGTAASALRAASDDGPHLYIWGAMGSALATRSGSRTAGRSARPMLAVLGDGER